MRRRLGLKARFIGIITILLTAMFIVIAVILIRANTSSLRSDLQDRSKAFATLATTPIGTAFVTYQDSGTFLIRQQIASFQRLDPNIAGVSIVGLDGTILYSSSDHPAAVTTTDAASFDPIYKYSSGTINRIIYPYIADNGSHSYAIVYDISSKAIDKAVMDLGRSIMLYSFIGLLVSAISMYFIIDKFFLQPVRRLRDKAIVIASGFYDEQIPAERDDEIGDLAKSTKQMAERLKADIIMLQEADKIKSEFMMIAAHNLRTPLAIIKGYLSLAQNLKPGEEMSEILGNISNGTKRLEHFAEDIITIASFESGQHLFTAEKFALNPILNGLAKEFTGLAKEKHITFNVALPLDTITVSGSPVHLRSALGNLLENAYKFTPENGAISFKCTVDGNSVHISITDSGIGIKPEEIGKLFTKFHRGTDTLSYNYEGAGIGLYVTKLIITEHNGSIAVDSAQGHGSTFTVTLPVFKEQPTTDPAGSTATATSTTSEP